MFSIDVNTLKGERFVVPPLKPLSLHPGNPQLASGVSVKSPSALLNDVKIGGSEADLSDGGLSDVWTTKPDQGIVQNLVSSFMFCSGNERNHTRIDFLMGRACERPRYERCILVRATSESVCRIAVPVRMIYINQSTMHMLIGAELAFNRDWSLIPLRFVDLSPQQTS